ncbi:7690_t:CDS:10 [Funneliformis geosporum]|uniref:7690_t:CDS:1 n=1 Tax=Funneliformis geosporum TaxID=1117311 RepID=A0A9W4SDX4_9GLOM|nr:7690_t:CDS:10 [Funneliformis geosporum]
MINFKIISIILVTLLLDFALSELIETPPNVGELQEILNPTFYITLLQNKSYPGTENREYPCHYISTPRPEDNITIAGELITWDCPAGTWQPDTLYRWLSLPAEHGKAQPVYCCPGYYCNENGSELSLCPEGHFCELGSVVPTSCHGLASCPPGSMTATRYRVAFLLMIMVGFFLILFKVKKKVYAIKIAKYKNLLNEQKLQSGMKLEPVSRTFDIEFKNLGLILPNVSGKLSKRKTCAIMGPSGAGKTTFVSLLTGKVKKTSGTIKVNGVEEPLEKYRKLIGYVPQEDIMLRELSVREILVHSAMMRLPNDMNRAAKKQKVIETISFLELGHIMDSPIGNEEKRGISGGQRKRVNIGMELVAEPSILFLDEPTSGLDSATSLEMCKLLKNIAHQQGLTVAAIIHSPSDQAFRQFDDFMLLGKGGMVIYFGERDIALNYFENLGFVCPPDESPSDFMMEIASGKVQPVNRKFSIADLSDIWDNYISGRKNPTLNLASSHIAIEVNCGKSSVKIIQKFKTILSSFLMIILQKFRDVVDYFKDIMTEFSSFLRTTFYFWERDPIRETPNVFTAFALLFKRACLQFYRNRSQFLFDTSLHLACGAFVSLSNNNLTYVGRPPRELCIVTPFAVIPFCLIATDYLQTGAVFFALGSTFSGISGNSTFGYEKVVYWRDTSSGMRSLPYFLAKVTADIPRVLNAAIMFSTSYLLFYSYQALYSEIYIITLLSYCCSWTMGYFLSIIVNKEQMALIGTGFSLAWSLVFSGKNPELTVVSTSDTYKYVRWLWKISPPRWVVEALYLKEISPRKWYEIHNEPLRFTYSFEDYEDCLINLGFIAYSWAALAFCAMKLVNRKKQK